MAIENINVGVAPNDGTGLTLRDAFIVVNGNFAQIDTKSEVDAKIISATNPLLVRISDVEGDIEQINSELDTLSTISYVDAQIALVNSNINTVDNKVNLINTDLTALTFRVENIETILPNKLNDAPIDGKLYGRKDGAWIEVTGGGSVDAYTKAESDALFTTKDETTTWVNHFNNQNVSLANQMVTLDAQNVKLTGGQTISGVKTFSNSPSVPTPTNASQAANKTYVDSVTASKANQTEITRIDNELATKATNTTVNTLDAQNVKITGNQTIGGVKAFSSSPTVPTATTNTQAVNKGQMDAAIAAGGGGDLSNYYTKAQSDSLFTTQTSTNNLIATTVRLTGSQTVAGIKTFSDSPIVPTPTVGNQASNKTYVDAEVSSKANTSTVNTLDAQNVKITGAQNISGVKTFSQSPIVPAPTTDTQAATKKYVDDAVASGAGGNAVLLTGNQTVAGVKTFTSSPKAPVATTFNDVVIKQQMDSELAGKVSQTYFDMFESETEADIIALENNVSSLQGSVSSLDSRVSSVEGQLSNKVDNSTFTALDNNVVKLSGNQSMNGVKTFNNSPVVPLPTTFTQAANKQYVDNTISDVLSNRKNITTNTTIDSSYHKAIVFVTGNSIITIPSTLGNIDFVIKCNATSTATFAMGSGSTLEPSSTGLIVEPKGMASVITMGSNIIITGGI